ncbi:hypothetical protein X777_08570 [Ooceraea biroi]|uniref:Uncharacterized protein n=1 Tax=Ooceraea biroi TaxID=2015173 RepID=A0A026W8J8_OOCBI|nr:hypothetical protein X777_08570 [Ooceraea biroi]
MPWATSTYMMKLQLLVIETDYCWRKALLSYITRYLIITHEEMRIRSYITAAFVLPSSLRAFPGGIKQHR